MRPTIVVPTIREEQIKKFLECWNSELKYSKIIIVEDNESKTFDIKENENLVHYSHEEINNDLKDKSWIIPSKTAAVRSYGYIKAWQDPETDFIVTIDDDCVPYSENFLSVHKDNLECVTNEYSWFNTCENFYPRGFPYENFVRKNKVMISHGLWKNVPDLDSVGQLMYERENIINDSREYILPSSREVIPLGMFFPMSGMNIAFKKEIVPAMYFLLMGLTRPFDRFCDIWCGIIVKKIVDHLGYRITNGTPLIFHQRASNKWINLRKENNGLEVNEKFWEIIDNITFTSNEVHKCYQEVSSTLINLEDDKYKTYWESLGNAMNIWLSILGY